MWGELWARAIVWKWDSSGGAEGGREGHVCVLKMVNWTGVKEREGGWREHVMTGVIDTKYFSKCGD